jgi:hypothetical protein
MLVSQDKNFTEIVNAGYPKGTVSRVIKALKDGENPDAPPPEVPPEKTEKTTSSGSRPAGAFITKGNRPPVLFDLGQEVIPLDWRCLYESHRYYEDFVAEEELDDSFGSFILWCVKDVWKRLRTEVKIISGNITVEVTDVDHGRTLEEESRGGDKGTSGNGGGNESGRSERAGIDNIQN